MEIKKLQEKAQYLKKLLDPDRMEKEKKKEGIKGLAKGLAIGSVIGGLAGLLFSPDTGKNNREKVKVELEKVKYRLGDNLEEGKEKFSEIYGEKREVLTEKVTVLRDRLHRKENMLDNEEEMNIVEEVELETEEDKEA